MSGILSAIEMSSKGLSVQRAKMNTVAENMANVETAETPEGGPYRRKRVVVSEDKKRTTFRSVLKQAGGHLVRTHEAHRKGNSIKPGQTITLPSVEMKEIEEPRDAYRLVYDPGHPQADEEGYVKMPDVDVIEEMVDMMAASRSYEANTIAISTAKKMANDALDI